MSLELDKLFFRNFAVVVVLLAVMMVVFAVIAVWMSGKADLGYPADRSVDARTMPIGQVRLHTDPAPAPSMDASEPAVVPPAGGAPVSVAAADTEATTAVEDGAVAAGTDGEAVYNGLCLACHGSGIPGIPQLGDKEAWAPRVAKGAEALYANAISGYTGESGMPMPARGGNPDLSDAEVKAAVDFMVDKSQ